MTMGLAILLIVFGCAAVALLGRVSQTTSRSQKFALVALACGAAAFMAGLCGPVFDQPDEKTLLFACGLGELTFAFVAVVLAIRTFSLRRKEQNAGVKLPITAILAGVANLFCGAGIVATGSGMLVPNQQGNEWTWKSGVHGFEVTLPTSEWKEAPNQKAVAFFTCSRPHSMGIVGEVRPAQTDAEHESALAVGRKIGSNTLADRIERTGVNRHGNPYWILMGEERNGKEPYYTGVSVTRVAEKAVVMMYEGQYRLASQAGRSQEAAAFRNQAEMFLSSVK